MTANQIKYVRRLMRDNDIDEEAKEQIVLELTNGATSHLSDLSHAQTQQLIGILAPEQQTTRKKMENKVFWVMHEIGKETPEGKVDMEWLDSWCLKYSPAHKEFDDLTDQELTQVVTIFKKMYAEHLAR